MTLCMVPHRTIYSAVNSPFSPYLVPLYFTTQVTNVHYTGLSLLKSQMWTTQDLSSSKLVFNSLCAYPCYASTVVASKMLNNCKYPTTDQIDAVASKIVEKIKGCRNSLGTGHVYVQACWLLPWRTLNIEWECQMFHLSFLLVQHQPEEHFFTVPAVLFFPKCPTNRILCGVSGGGVPTLLHTS